MIRKNIGLKDRIVRFAVAAVLLIVAYVNLSFWLLAAGLFVLFEASFSWCILYQILGKNSCPIKK